MITDWDIGILLYIQENWRTPVLSVIFKVITSLANGGWFWIVLTLALCVPKKTRRAGVMAAVALALGAIITNLLLKNTVARIRPYDLCDALEPIIKRPKDYSFPSGHTTASMAAAFSYCKYLKKRFSLPLLLLGLAIAFSRLYVGVHYPTDVLGGMVVAGASCVISFFIAKAVFQKWEKQKQDVLKSK